MITDISVEKFIRDSLNGGELPRLVILAATTFGLVAIPILVFKFVLRGLRGFRLYIWRQLVPSDYVKKYGKWAIVTGATDGIGLSTAKELARRGHSVILVGRNPTKLQKAQTDVAALLKSGAEALTVKIDLATATASDYDRVRTEIDADNKDIGVLVNNAGFIYEKYRLFHKFTGDECSDMINVNVLGYVNFARIILPGMVQRKRGLVVNISSILGTLPALNMCLYGPTKSFIDAFSLQLQLEYSKTSIDIINMTPGAVHTKLLTNAADVGGPSSLMWPTSDSYAKSMLNAASTGIGSISGCMAHAFHFALGRVFLSCPCVYKASFDLNTRMHIKDHDLTASKVEP